MSEGFAVIISITLYKLVSLGVGFAFAYMGYKLFISGIWGGAGDLQARYGDNKLVLKSAAPGTFFALFGTIIVAVVVWRGLELKATLKESRDTLAEGNRGELPPKPPF